MNLILVENVDNFNAIVNVEVLNRRNSSFKGATFNLFIEAFN